MGSRLLQLALLYWVSKAIEHKFYSITVPLEFLEIVRYSIANTCVYEDTSSN